MMKRERWLVPVSLLLLFMLAAFVAQRLSEPRAGHLVAANERRPMPPLSMVDTAGRPWSMAEHRGQVVLVNYWATWCGPCLQESPGLARLADDAKVAVLGISLDAGGDTPANRDKVAAFASRFEIGYPLAFPAAGSQMEFGLEGIPTTVLVDRRGRVAKVYEGAVRRTVFQADIERLRREP